MQGAASPWSAVPDSGEGHDPAPARSSLPWEAPSSLHPSKRRCPGSPWHEANPNAVTGPAKNRARAWSSPSTSQTATPLHCAHPPHIPIPFPTHGRPLLPQSQVLIAAWLATGAGLCISSLPQPTPEHPEGQGRAGTGPHWVQHPKTHHERCRCTSFALSIVPGGSHGGKPHLALRLLHPTTRRDPNLQFSTRRAGDPAPSPPARGCWSLKRKDWTLLHTGTTGDTGQPLAVRILHLGAFPVSSGAPAAEQSKHGAV